MAQLPVTKFMSVYGRSFRPRWTWALILTLVALFVAALVLRPGW